MKVHSILIKENMDSNITNNQRDSSKSVDCKPTSSLKERRPLETIQENAINPDVKANMKKTLKLNIYEDYGLKLPKKLGRTEKKDVQSQTDTSTKFPDPLCIENPEESYWKVLAQTQQNSLDKALQSNEELKEKLKTLEEENSLLKEVVQRAEDIMEAVKEWSSDI